MSVSLKNSDAAQIRELFVLYSKKSAFNIDEYVDVGGVYKRVVDAIGESKSPDDVVSLEKKDAAFIYTTMNVCSQRAPVEIQNYKAIASLFELLASLLKDMSVEDTEETKEN
jgi:hypothetical protein